MILPEGLADPVIFNCNICGTTNQVRVNDFHREKPDCSGCGSTPRFRGLVKIVSEGLFGERIPLRGFPVSRERSGVGFSEWPGYVAIFEEKFSFKNTYFHQEPRLDIMSDDWQAYQNLDFVICSEVFEHVLQPLSRGLANLHRMLKPGGLLVFSVPFTDREETREHFPGLSSFATVQLDGRWLVVNKLDEGSYHVFDKNVFFHGGPGTVLEMRLFGRGHLMALLNNAGFDVTLHSSACPEVGYVWVDREERAGAGLSLSWLIEARALPVPGVTVQS